MASGEIDMSSEQPVAHSQGVAKLTFGIYPGSATGGEPGLLAWPPDDPERIVAALDELQGTSSTFIVRGYVHYLGNGASCNATPVEIERYVTARRRLDMALCYRDPAGDVEGWLRYVRATVRRLGPYLASLQIAEEPNNPDPEMGGDGSFPNVVEAIVRGVVAAKNEAHLLGYPLYVGFNATPSFGADPFWAKLAASITPEFLRALGYVGLDFFPDVFRPLAADGEPGDIRSSVALVVRSYRETLTAGGIPASVPIRICENGWSTDEGHSEQRQAEVLDTIVRVLDAQRETCNITHYIYHNLRDTDSAQPDKFYHLGLMRSDYSPKPAFGTYRRLIRELGAK